MKTTQRSLSALALLLVVAGATPTTDIVPVLLANLDKYTHDFAQEKVWLHTDKPYYALGDEIWLKVQVADANAHTPTLLSRIAYVELVRPDQQLHRRLMLDLDTLTGTATADFALPDSLPAGTYRLRAYTNWMRNFGDGAAFDRPLEVFDPRDAATQPAYAPQARLEIFPEGGDLVAGVRCRVGFKVADKYGRGLDGGGLVVDDQGVTVARFQSSHRGLGAFRFVPGPGRRYTARLHQPDSSVAEFALPPVKEEGIILTLSHAPTDTAFRLQVLASQALAAAKPEVILLGQSRGKVHFAARGQMDGPLFTVLAPKSRFPEGVVQWTLFNAQGEPLAERLAYHRRGSQLALEVAPAKTVYRPREKVEVEVRATGPGGQPLAAALSLAVTDAGKVKYDEVGTEHIAAYLLLSSEVKGDIEAPGYYFQPMTKEVHDALDLLLITQGWRRFAWKELASGKMPALNYFIEQSFGVGGTVNLPNGQPLRRGNLTLMVANQDGLVANTQTDSLGRFFLGGLDYRDTIKLVVQARTEKDRKRLNIKMDERTYPPLGPRSFPAPAFLAAEYLANRRQQTQADLSFNGLADQVLREVEVKGSKPRNGTPDDGRFRLHSQADMVLKDKDLNFGKHGANILQILQGRMTGAVVTPNGAGGYNIQMIRGGSPLLLIDGVPQADPAEANRVFAC
jgi:hypothetical protein